MWYALNNMHTLTDLSEHVFRWLDYFKRSTLGKSWEMYNFDRCFFSCRRCKKGQFYSDQIICWNMYPGDFHGHYVQLLIRAWKFIYRLHVQVRWAEHILWTIFLFWRSKRIFHDTSERLMFQHIIYFMVGMWSYLRASRKCRHFYYSKRYH